MSDAKGAPPKAPAPSTPDLDELDSDWGSDGDEGDGGATVVGRLEDLVAATRVDSDAHDTDRPSDVITARPPPMVEGGPTVVVDDDAKPADATASAPPKDAAVETLTAKNGVSSDAKAVDAKAAVDDDEDEEDEEDDDDVVDDSAWDIPEEPEPPEAATWTPEERATAKKARDEARAARKEKAKAKALAAREKKKQRAEALQKKQKKKKKSIRPPKPATPSKPPPAESEDARDQSGPISVDPSPTLRKARPIQKKSSQRDWQRMAAFVAAVVVVGALLMWLLKHR